MSEELGMRDGLRVIAHFKSPFASKFGVPRQSGLVSTLRGQVVMTDEFSNVDYLRGIEEFEYIWLVWGFNANEHVSNSPLVRPPVLGGNEHRGVFATRSPFRPNAIGLSSVRLESVNLQPTPTLTVLGADLMDGTPIYDIKPYIPYSDAHPDARAGFADAHYGDRLQVVLSPEVASQSLLSENDVATLCEVLSHDPRPRYHSDASRVYGMEFMHHNVRFVVDDERVVVISIIANEQNVLHK